jgi:hypothetical protein
MLLGKKRVSKGKTMFFPLALLFFHWGAACAERVFPLKMRDRVATAALACAGKYMYALNAMSNPNTTRQSHDAAASGSTGRAACSPIARESTINTAPPHNISLANPIGPARAAAWWW